MACMFNKYFELASYNNIGESLACVVAEIAFISGCDDFLSCQDHFYRDRDHF